jgi:hypothetical protein
MIILVIETRPYAPRWNLRRIAAAA